MNWTKYDVNELLFIDHNNPDICVDIVHRLKCRALCAQFEDIPPNRVLSGIKANPQHELKFIENDIKSAIKKRDREKTRYKDAFSANSLLTVCQQSADSLPPVDKTRLDKTQLDELINKEE